MFRLFNRRTNFCLELLRAHWGSFYFTVLLYVMLPHFWLSLLYSLKLKSPSALYEECIHFCKLYVIYITCYMQVIYSEGN